MNSKVPEKQYIEGFKVALSVVFLLGLIIGSQFLIYYLLIDSVKTTLGDNGAPILIGIIVFSFLFVGSAAIHGIKNAFKPES